MLQEYEGVDWIHLAQYRDFVEHVDEPSIFFKGDSALWRVSVHF